jgi:hypothetical protein
MEKNKYSFFFLRFSVLVCSLLLLIFYFAGTGCSATVARSYDQGQTYYWKISTMVFGGGRVGDYTGTEQMGQSSGLVAGFILCLVGIVGLLIAFALTFSKKETKFIWLFYVFSSLFLIVSSILLFSALGLTVEKYGAKYWYYYCDYLSTFKDPKLGPSPILGGIFGLISTGLSLYLGVSSFKKEH